MGDILERITLCTYSTGSTMVREVLEDWIQFLGGRPKRVIFAVSPSINPPPIYAQLKDVGLIDEIIAIDTGSQTIKDIDQHAVIRAVQSAETEWVVLIKMDTLPYRSGYDNWLSEDMAIVDKYKLFGITGSFVAKAPESFDGQHCLTRQYSHNFAIFRRSEWVLSVEQQVGADWNGPIFKNPAYAPGGEASRFAVEAGIERYLEITGKRMLIRLESKEYSVFHVNVWGDQLRKTRDVYRTRRSLKPYLNTGQTPKRLPIHEWEFYYMYPKPRLFQRLRIWTGQLRRNLGLHS